MLLLPLLTLLDNCAASPGAATDLPPSVDAGGGCGGTDAESSCATADEEASTSWTSQTRTTLSSPPLARNRPSGLNLMLHIEPSCARTSCRMYSPVSSLLDLP